LFAINIMTALAFFEFAQQFNLVEHERRSWGLTGMALELVTAPVYVAAAAAQLAGRPLAYVVTPKGAAATGDTLRTFRPHLGWATVAAACLVSGRFLGHNYPSLYVWASLTLLICLAPVAHLLVGRLRRKIRRTVIPVTTALPQSYPVPTQRRIGEILIRQGLLTQGQLDSLLDLQATDDRPWQRLGDLAIEQGYVSAGQLTTAIRQESLEHPVTSLPKQRPSSSIDTAERLHEH
ncbi:MAG TPA: hypothetical protein VI248_22675, partial [Kineosporiaceae bacterium]